MPNLGRPPGNVSGANGLVRVLNFAFALINARLRRDIFRPVLLGNELAGLLLHIWRNAGGIGTHIGYQTHHALLANADTLKKLLGQLHSLFSQQAVLAISFLLHAAGGKRSHWVAFALPLADFFHLISLPLDDRQNFVHLLLIVHLGCFAVNPGQLCFHQAAFRLQSGMQSPVFLRHKGVNFRFAVANHSHRHRLHTSGGKALFNLGPQQRRKLVTHQTIQHPAGLLGVNAVHIQPARRFHRLFYRFLGNLMKLHPALFIHIVQITLEMIGNHLPFTVRVACQQHAVGPFGLRAQAFQNRSLAANGNIMRFKLIFHIHAQRAFGQIPHVPH